MISVHATAHEYVAKFATTDKIDVIDIGSRDINGTVRDLFPNAAYVGVDVVDGNGVDVVADATTWTPKRKADLVVCCGVFEHTEVWREIVTNAAGWLRKGGRMVLTCAGPGWPPHSAVDGGPIHAGEFYANVTPEDLSEVMTDTGLDDVDVISRANDLFGTGVNG